MRTVAVVLAGGTGRRFGGSTPKQARLLGGRTLVEHCVAAFDASPAIDEVLVVAAAGLTQETARQLAGYRKLADVVPGGAARTDSTSQAIAALRRGGPDGPDSNVLFHDAARPLVDQRIIADCAAALRTWQAIGVVVPTADTIVEVADGRLGQVLPRASLARCQTPQGFRLSVISRAYELAAADPGFAALSATDDCGVVRRYLPDVPIGAVPGSERNLKITYPGDLDIAEVLLRQDAPAAPERPPRTA